MNVIKNIPQTIAASKPKNKFPPLSDRGKAADANNNGLIERSEAGGPLAANFDEIDCDKNGGLDGAEIPAFFQGTGCPKKISSEKKTGPSTQTRCIDSPFSV